MCGISSSGCRIDTIYIGRDRPDWLTKGDHNTSFFHTFASERKRVNTIKILKGDNGEVVEDRRRLKFFITKHYKSLFQSHASDRREKVFQCVHPKVTGEMNEALLKLVTEEEVKNALGSIGDLKALGPDGMSAIFYKKFWNIVGEKVQQEVVLVLNGGEMLNGWNETTVVLIPKVKLLEHAKDRRPLACAMSFTC